MRLRLLAALLLVALAACIPAAPEATPQVLRVQYTFAARPWLADLQACASGRPGFVIAAEERPASSLDPHSAELVLRLGAPPHLISPSYALGEEKIRIIVHPENPLDSLTAVQSAGLFSGRLRNWKELGGPDLPVQVWTFNEAEDLQQGFRAAILQGGPVTPLARQAQSPEEMAAGVAADPAAIGLLPERFLDAGPRPLKLEADGLVLPLLAILPEEPQGSLREILACMQK